MFKHGMMRGGAVVILMAVVLLLQQCGAPEQAATEGEWVSIFNGQNLDGWQPKICGYDLNDNFGNTFRVEDGVMKVAYDQYDQFNDRFGHIFYKEKLSHYRLRVEYRFVGEQVPGGPAWAIRNNGIMFHCQAPESMTKDQKFPVSIEAQMLGGDGVNERPSGNACSPGTHIVMNDTLVTPHVTYCHGKTYHGDQWVTYELEVHGSGAIRHIVNGEVVLEYEQPQYDPKDKDAQKLITGDNLLLSEGYVALQAESAPIEFRKIELMKLNP